MMLHLSKKQMHFGWQGALARVTVIRCNIIYSEFKQSEVQQTEPNMIYILMHIRCEKIFANIHKQNSRNFRKVL